MRNELALAIKHLSSERNLPKEVVIEAIEAALASAYRKTPDSKGQNVIVKVDEETYKPYVYLEKEVVAKVEEPRGQISLEDARRISPSAEIGGMVRIDVTPHDFGRIAAQTAKQVILQRIREAERDLIYTTYKQREGEIVQGTVQTVEPRAATLVLDNNVEAILPKKEQIPRERLVPNQRIRVYIAEVNKTPRGPEIIVSRTHRNMLRRLLELEVPEIFNGTVEIKAIAREAGSRSKIAVASRQEGVDPVGACVGLRGVRIQALVNELGGEKIDVIEWDPDPAIFIAKALSPAIVVNVKLMEGPEGRTASVVVPDKQLSLAIGKDGQNARLAAKLTGWRIDISSESEAAQEALRRAKEEERRAAEKAELEAARKLLAEAEAAAQREQEAIPEVAVEEETVAAAEEAETPAPAMGVAPEVEAAEAVPMEMAAPSPEQQREVAQVAPEVAEAPVPARVAPEAVKKPEPVAAKAEVPAERKMALEDLKKLKVEEGEEELEELPFKGAKKKPKGMRWEYDPVSGRMVMRRERKPGRRKADWHEVVQEEEKVEDEDFLSSFWRDDTEAEQEEG